MAFTQRLHRWLRVTVNPSSQTNVAHGIRIGAYNVTPDEIAYGADCFAGAAKPTAWGLYGGAAGGAGWDSTSIYLQNFDAVNTATGHLLVVRWHSDHDNNSGTDDGAGVA